MDYLEDNTGLSLDFTTTSSQQTKFRTRPTTLDYSNKESSYAVLPLTRVRSLFFDTVWTINVVVFLHMLQPPASSYHKVASSRPVYYSILESFCQRSQYSIKFPHHNSLREEIDYILMFWCHLQGISH